MIVVAGGRLDCGGWGGLLSRAAAHKGVRGAIVDGATRDVDDANEIGFPVFARGSAAPTARGRQREIASGITVEIGTVAVSPGDLVIADGTGVVVVRYVNIEEVLSAAQVIFAKEQAMAQRIADGEPVTGALSREYESMVAVKEGRPMSRALARYAVSVLSDALDSLGIAGQVEDIHAIGRPRPCAVLPSRSKWLQWAKCPGALAIISMTRPPVRSL